MLVARVESSLPARALLLRRAWIAGVADPIAIAIALIEIRRARAVVRAVDDGVAIAIHRAVAAADPRRDQIAPRAVDESCRERIVRARPVAVQPIRTAGERDRGDTGVEQRVPT